MPYRSELKFEPKFIIWSINRTIIASQEERKHDIVKLIACGIERGNDLEKIERTSKPEAIAEIKRLRETYKLVSKANKSKYAVTLSRVCVCFPWLTCHYLRVAKNPTVSFIRMESISRDYPRVMMTAAFAYLIPNKPDIFCSLLKKAHMLHQYEFFRTISGVDCPTTLSADHKRRIIQDVKKRTQVAINGSFVERDTQLTFLKQFGVIIETENGMIVSNPILEAVKVWEELEIKYNDYPNIDFSLINLINAN